MCMTPDPPDSPGISRSPLVSIIVPSFNQGRFIRETIESCLCQDYRPLEVVIIDGASTDGTVGVLHGYDNVPEVRWISEPDSGVAEAVNKGFAVARGEIAGIQSSDDAYLPGAVSGAVACFTAEPSLGLVYGDVQNMDAAGRELKLFRSAPFSLETFLCKSTLILQPAAFFRLALARELGGWTPAYFVCDTELWLRMAFRAPARKVDAVWGLRHMHDVQRNTQGRKIADSYRKMIDESPDLATAPHRLRRAARCGRLLTDAVYREGGATRRRVLYWGAYLSFPDVLETQPKLAAQLVPGYWTLDRWYGRLRRGIGRLLTWAGERHPAG